MTNRELEKYLNQHGRITYVNKLGLENILYGYIREVRVDYVLWEDNELPYRCKIKNVVEFKVMKLPEWRK